MKVYERCDHCQLDLTKADAGDGPAVFVITLLGALVVAEMMVLEFLYAPSLWLHIIIMSVVCGVGTYILLPLCKSFLIGMQYRMQAGDVAANRLDE